MTDSPRSLWPSALCAATSAVFVCIAGAFLVGVLMTIHPGAFLYLGMEVPVHSHGMATLRIALYAAAAACFAVGIGSLFLAYRKMP